MRIRTVDKGRSHRRELLIKDEVVSWLRVIDYQMRIGLAQVRMAGVGGVNTKEKYRMKGYMQRLMEDTVEYMKDEGYDLSMLFGIPNFYTKFGYVTCLPSYRLTLSTRNAEEAKEDAMGYKIGRIEKEDINPILKLYNKNNRDRTCSVVRTKKYFSGFPKGSQMRKQADIFLIKDGKKLLAYAAFDKSRERVNIVEIEGEKEKIFPTLLYEFAKMAIERRCGQINIFLPPDHAFAEFSHRYGCESRTTYPKKRGGMIRIINQGSLFKKMHSEFERRVQQSELKKYSISLKIKTELETTTIFLNRALRAPSRSKKEYFLKLPQTKLIQLIIGYRTPRDILNNPDVKGSNGVEPLMRILSSKSAPYLWLADHF